MWFRLQQTYFPKLSKFTTAINFPDAALMGRREMIAAAFHHNFQGMPDIFPDFFNRTVGQGAGR
jgi:hypothetical protein